VRPSAPKLLSPLFAFFLAVAVALDYLNGGSGRPALSPLEALFFLLLVGGLHLLVVPLPGAGRVTLGALGNTALAFLAPPWQAGLIAFLGFPLRKEPWEKQVFNRAQLGLSTVAASLAAHLLSPPLSVVLAFLAYFGVNTLSVLALFQAMGLPVRSLWERGMKPFAWSYLGIGPYAYLLARLYQRPVATGSGFLDLLLGLAPAFYLYFAWRSQKELLESVERTVLAMVRTLEAKDPYTAYHSERVGAIALHLADKLGLSEADKEAIRMGAALHDLGKVGVPDAVLLKEGGLSPGEWERMRLHPEIGAIILEPLRERFASVLPLVLHHHERLDGRGYPHGLKGEEIPFLARVLAVADAYEAMTSDRPYRKALSPEEALRRLEEGAGTQFDPKVVAAMREALAEDPPWKEKDVWTRTMA